MFDIFYLASRYPVLSDLVHALRLAIRFVLV